jgi:hypothetical protein
MAAASRAPATATRSTKSGRRSGGQAKHGFSATCVIDAHLTLGRYDMDEKKEESISAMKLNDSVERTFRLLEVRVDKARKDWAADKISPIKGAEEVSARLCTRFSRPGIEHDVWMQEGDKTSKKIPNKHGKAKGCPRKVPPNKNGLKVGNKVFQGSGASPAFGPGSPMRHARRPSNLALDDNSSYDRTYDRSYDRSPMRRAPAHVTAHSPPPKNRDPPPGLTVASQANVIKKPAPATVTPGSSYASVAAARARATSVSPTDVS